MKTNQLRCALMCAMFALLSIGESYAQGIVVTKTDGTKIFSLKKGMQ